MHGYVLTANELCLRVSSVFIDELVHPSYKCTVEEGGFTAWRREDCRAR